MQDIRFPSSLRAGTRVALIDAHAPYRIAFEAHPALHANALRCVASFNSLLTAPISLLRELDINFLLIDPGTSMRELSAFMELFHKACPRSSIVILRDDASLAAILTAFQCGADGYLLKSDPIEYLLAQLHEATRGAAPMSGRVARTLIQHHRTNPPPETRREPTLSEREQQALNHLSAGAGYKDVAETMGISLNTLRTHVRRLYRKLGVNSIREATRKVPPGIEKRSARRTA
jgi:DNA-binding NarL/FixJ family response regulator